jgi:V8-like Glu-specific endopeptidase
MISTWKSLTLNSGFIASSNYLRQIESGLISKGRSNFQNNFEINIVDRRQNKKKISRYEPLFDWPTNSKDWSLDSSTGLFMHDHVENIIGVDEREKVDNIKVWPFSSIGLLSIKFPAGSGTATATLIDGQYLITAAHCVYMKKYGGWIKAARFAPASFLGQMPFGFGDACKIWVHEEWINNENSDFDIALICIDNNFSSTCGYLAVAALDDLHLIHKGILICGYPADRDHAQNQYMGKDFLTGIEQTRIGYVIDTYESQSGSAVMLIDNTVDPYCIVGVHTKGSYTQNSATRIRNDMLKDIFDLMINPL